MKEQLTNKFVMVRPNYFGFNPETGVDNIFQNRPDSPEAEVRERAMREFNKMVERLETYGMTVVQLDSPLGLDGEITPDAIFPNNWFSTHPERLVLYPMKAKNRRMERQPEKLREALLGINVVYPQTWDFTRDEEEGHILEGTGSLVLDRTNRIAYALGSQRTNQEELNKWSSRMGYKPFFFHAVDMGGRPVYHTNVVMSVGEKMAVVCLETMQEVDERERLMGFLEETGKEVVIITMGQMYDYCGNILQTINGQGESLVVMSERARGAFSHTQLGAIERHGLVIPVAIDTIETVGGGSARCMMAEVF